MILERLEKQGVLQLPSWMINSVEYMTLMGSEAYGCSSNNSDIDYYGFCIPPKSIVFPHENGTIIGFDTDYERFEQWSQHHCIDKSSQKEYDFSVYNVVKYFRLLTDNNPNICDSLFVPARCIHYITPVGELLRENRKMFLHKGSYHKFKGYSYSMYNKIKTKSNASNPKRAADIETNGYDTKFAMNVVRLAEECKQILVEHDLDIERNREQLKSIRRGEWTIERFEKYFVEQESILEDMYAKSDLRHSPDEKKIKELLLNVLEIRYGSIDAAFKQDVNVDAMVKDLESLIRKYR